MSSDTKTSNNNVEWPTEATQYELSGKIGTGAFATVWKASTTCTVITTTTTATNATTTAADQEQTAPKSTEQQQQLQTTKEECAIKILNLDHVDSNLAEIRLEVQAMRLSSHPNILSCYSAFVNNTDLWLVTQLMRKGSSLHCLQGARKRMYHQHKQEEMASPPLIPNMEPHIMYVLHESLLGLKYIHENGQIHRDIKAGNILLDSNGDVRIADFGVSGWLVNAGSQQEKAKTFVGTPCWMAPEVMEQIHGYDYKADIWSLGITALELAKGYAPYAKYPPMRVLILTIQEDPPSLDTYDEEDGGDEYDDLMEYCDEEEYSKSFRSFVDSCLQKNPAKRPKSTDLLQSRPLAAFQDPAYRESQRRAMVEQVCDLVDDVGTPVSEGTGKGHHASKSGLPGNIPISILTEKNRPAGTTWVFADGSQVLSSSAKSSSTVDDVLDEIELLGVGEHYVRDEFQQQQQKQHEPPASSSSGGVSSETQQNDESAEQADDLNAFMDEFEMNTQGEDFRRDV